MARPKRSEIKRVPLTPEEKEFLGKIMDKAVAAEKAGKLKEALDLYTDYKNELLRIKEQKQEIEVDKRKEKVWQFVIQTICDKFAAGNLSQFLINKYQQAEKIEEDDVGRMAWQEKIQYVEQYQLEVDEIIEDIVGWTKVKNVIEDKFGVSSNNPLDIFDISDEELEKYNQMDPFDLQDYNAFFRDTKWELKPEIKKETEKFLRTGEQVQEYVEELYKKQTEKEK